MANKFEFTREWFLNPDNQVHTRQDVELFKGAVNGSIGKTKKENIVEIGEHFLVDLYPVYDNGVHRSSTDVEIWEVENTNKEIFHKRRGVKLPFKAIKKVTTGRKFGYPNGYWKVPEYALVSGDEQ